MKRIMASLSLFISSKWIFFFVCHTPRSAQPTWDLNTPLNGAATKNSNNPFSISFILYISKAIHQSNFMYILYVMVGYMLRALKRNVGSKCVDSTRLLIAATQHRWEAAINKHKSIALYNFLLQGSPPSLERSRCTAEQRERMIHAVSAGLQPGASDGWCEQAAGTTPMGAAGHAVC